MISKRNYEKNKANAMKSICTSLELSKKLKEVGFPQESLFYWWVDVEDSDEEKIDPEVGIGKSRVSFMENISAPTAEEIGRELPEYLYKTGANYFLKMMSGIIYFKAQSADGKIFDTPSSSKSEANARAKMYIYLKENNLLPERNL